MANREWMRDPSKHSDEYIRGVNEFLEFAFQKSEVNGKIWCPCTICANYKRRCRSSVYEHLIDPRRGFLRGYRQWIFHGERPTASSSTAKQHSEMGHDMDGLIPDVLTIHPTKDPKEEELNKHNNEAGTSQIIQMSQSHMTRKNDIYSQVQRLEKRGHVCCIDKTPKPKKAKVVLSENQELHDRVQRMERLMSKVMTLIQNRFPGDVNNIIQAARQDTDASTVSGQMNFPSQETNKDNGTNED